jgi:hypothetical protein
MWEGILVRKRGRGRWWGSERDYEGEVEREEEDDGESKEVVRVDNPPIEAHWLSPVVAMVTTSLNRVV